MTGSMNLTCGCSGNFICNEHLQSMVVGYVRSHAEELCGADFLELRVRFHDGWDVLADDARSAEVGVSAVVLPILLGSQAMGSVPGMVAT